jgi:PPOX class probable F420-dependent enzyme
MKMDESVDHRLQTERAAWLCTLRPDGSAHITPVWFVSVGDFWWVGSRATSVKVRNLRADPRVVLTLANPDRPVVAEGVAEVFTERDFPPILPDLFVAKYGWDPTVVDGSGAPRVLLQVTVQRWLMAGTAG